MNKFIKNNRNKIIIAAGIFAIGIAIIGAGYYPVVIEGNHFITEATFARQYWAASFYYNALRETVLADIKDAQVLQPGDIKKAVLEQLIENSLVAREARRELGGDLGELIRKKIATYGDDAKIKDAAKKLYDLNYADFKNEILIPQAERDVLAAQFFLHGKDFEDWLKEAKKSARVRVFLNGLRWEDGEVK